MSALHKIALAAGTDKADHGYCRYYERHLPAVADVVLELGVGQGGSLIMWSQWYPFARIIGVDHDESVPTPLGCEVHHGDVTDPATFAGWLLECDLIIDDASHRPEDQLASFWLLWPSLAAGGWYAIEDTLCALHEPFGGDREGRALAELMRGIHVLAVCGGVEQMHVYGELILIKKRST
jgi:hypothetical protein